MRAALLWTSCGTQRLLRPLSGPCILLATAPTAPPCIPSFVAMRHLPPAGGSLWPQAAVVAVASAEELFIIEQCRAVCGPPGIAFSRERPQWQTAFADAGSLREHSRQHENMLLPLRFVAQATVNRRNTKNPLAERLGFFVLHTPPTE